MISIIIPIYNQAKKLEKTLESILKQTYTNWELILVNDGSKDDVEEVLAKKTKESLENNFLYLKQENRGAPSARNLGASRANGEYLFFCDADAILKPDALLKLRDLLINTPSAAYAYSSFYWGKKLFKLEEFSSERLKRAPFIHTMALIRHLAFFQVSWDENIKKFQDWDLWLSLLAKGYVGVFLDEALFKVSPGGHISSWLPAFAYKYFPFLKTVKKYNAALAVIKDKHKL